MDRDSESYAQRASRIRNEALAMPLAGFSVVEAWKVRILKEGYCGLLSYELNKPAKCMYCLIDNPYHCKFKTTEQKLLFEKVFHNGYHNPRRSIT